VIFAGALGARWLKFGRGTEPLASYQVLRAQDRAILLALAPAILKGALPASDPTALERSIKLTDAFLATQSPFTRSQFYRLCGALSLFHSWNSWTLEEAESFLGGLRTSWIRLRNHIYCSLLQLVIIPWYGEAEAWKAIGYPGPPSI
jgi:hypothetical protein